MNENKPLAVKQSYSCSDITLDPLPCGMAYAGKPFYSKNVVILNRTGYLVSNTESWYNVGYIH